MALKSIDIPDDWVGGAVFSPDRTALFVATNKKSGPTRPTLTCWDVATWKPRWTSTLAARATELAITNDGRFVYSVQAGRVPQVIDAATGALARELDTRTGWPTVWPTNDSDLVVIARTSQLVRWDLATGEATTVLAELPDPLESLAIDSSLALAALVMRDPGGGPNVSVVDLESRRALHTVSNAHSSGHLVFRTAASELVDIAGWNDLQQPVVYDARGGRKLAVVAAPDVVAPRAFALSGDGRWLAVGYGEQIDNHGPYEDLCVRIFDLDKRTLHRRVPLDELGEARTLAFDHAGHLLAFSAGFEPRLMAIPIA